MRENKQKRKALSKILHSTGRITLDAAHQPHIIQLGLGVHTPELNVVLSLARFLRLRERMAKMKTAKQLSVTLVNRPGRLVELLGTLSKEKVGFRALSIMDCGERGTLCFVPDDFERATDVLLESSIRFTTADVLLVELAGRSGGFRSICERLASDHLNIDYAYTSVDATGSKSEAVAIVKVNDLAKAQRLLSESGPAMRRRPGRRPVYAR